MTSKIDPMRSQQYEDGQLVTGGGLLDVGSYVPMTWEEYEERSDCFYARLPRMSPLEYQTRRREYAELCMRHPKFARRYEAQRAEQLRNKRRKETR